MLDAAFAALADPTRRAIVERVLQAPAPVNRLAEGFAMSRPAVSRHLKVLAEAGLIRVEARGRERVCHAAPEALREAASYLNRQLQFWQQRSQALGSFLDRQPPPPTTGAPAPAQHSDTSPDPNPHPHD